MNLLDLITNAALFLIMFAISSSLKKENFLLILKYPKELITGIFLQIVFLPLLAIVVLSFFNLPDFIKFGILIIAACPGGTTSNFISYLTKCNVELSIAMTSINSFITLITIPIVTSIGLKLYMSSSGYASVPIFNTVAFIFLVIIFPIFLSMSFNKYWPRTMKKLKPIFKFSSIILFAGIFLLKALISESSGGLGLTKELLFLSLWPTLIIHVLALVVPLVITKLLNIHAISRVTIGVEVGLQNTALAIVLTSSVLGIVQAGIPSLVYALYSFWTTTAFAIIANYFYTGNLIKFKELLFK